VLSYIVRGRSREIGIRAALGAETRDVLRLVVREGMIPAVLGIAAGTAALDAAGREALLHYVLRPPVAQERVEQRPDGLVRITLKKALLRRDDRGGHGPAVAALAVWPPACPHHGSTP
jgi:hypothetical protein